MRCDMTQLNVDILDMVSILIKIQEAGYCVFCEWSGHVSWFDIRICKSKQYYEETVYRSHYVGSTGGNTIVQEIEALEKFCNGLGIELNGICL